MYRRTVIALVVLAVAAGGAASAAGDDEQSRGPPFALVGTWEVTLNLPGAPPARVLATFNADGTTVESAAAPPTTRGASHGVWTRTAVSLSELRDQAGNLVVGGLRGTASAVRMHVEEIAERP